MPATKLLLIGHAGIPTGFARVLRALAERLGASFEVHLLGITLPGVEGRVGWQTAGPYTLHANSAELHSAETLLTLARRIQPDVCVVLDEPFVCAARVSTLHTLARRPRILCYCAADEEAQLPAAILPELRRADALVAFTQHARSLMLEAMQRQGLGPPEVRVIAHGVDTRSFHPLAAVEQPEPGSFVVLNANRNQPFKRMELTMRGFALFARDKPAGVKLYLHMASRARGAGESSWADRLGLRERLLGPQEEAVVHPELSDEALNQLYNACDVGLNTADREGWGLVSFEHAATGAAQIVPGLPSQREVWGEAALLLPTTPRPSAQVPGRISPSVQPEDVARALELLYSDPDARAAWGEKARLWASRPELQWANIAAQWKELIEAVSG